jgi:mitogen-activated protein kinase 1/3
VYSALDSNTKHRVAIKQLLIDRTSDSRKILSLIREIRFLRRLEHESIVNFLDVKLTPTAVYIEQVSFTFYQRLLKNIKNFIFLRQQRF